MNIKQASEQSGVSAPNIRFYEKEGLLTPARRQGNDYRDYTAGDVRTLKLIRMLRMLDVPLSTIKAVLRGEQPLQQALQAQQTVLEQQAAQLAAAGCEDRMKYTYHQMIANGTLPLTVGGGIGQSRLCMLMLEKAHIGEVQSSVWPEAMERKCADAGIILL